MLPWGITDRMTRLLAVVLELEQMFSLSLPAAERWMDAGVFVRVLDLALRESVSHVHRGLALRLHALRAVHSTWQPAAQRMQP